MEKEGVENLSLQDKDGSFLSFTSPLSSQSPAPQASPPPVERLSSELAEETLVEVKDGHPQDENKCVQEGTKVAESHGKELSEIEANCVKLQEQLHHSTEEISLLEQCLRGKEQELYAKEQDLNVLKDTLAKERALTEKLISKVEILQQQQQLAAEEIERLTREMETRKSRIKELWKTNCEQLNEFDCAMLAKDEELRSLRSLLLSESQITHEKSSEFLSTLAANKPSAI